MLLEYGLFCGKKGREKVAFVCKIILGLRLICLELHILMEMIQNQNENWII